MAFNRIKVGVAAAALLFVATPANAAFDFGDIICETTTTTGTGTLSLGGAVTNYVTFVSQIASGAVVPYHIRASDGTLETGTGTFTDATPDTLTRVADWSTDGSGAELTLPAGTHTVCVGPIASIFNGAKGFQLYTADAGAVGGVLPFWHDSATPADGDIAGEIQVWGGADDEEIASIMLEVDDGATTTEDTRWRFIRRVAGADLEAMTLGDTAVGGNKFLTTGAFEALIAQSNNDGSAGGVVIYNNSATPADNDEVAWIALQGNDDGATRTSYGGVSVRALDVTDATEDGDMRLQVMSGGSALTALTLGASDIGGAGFNYVHNFDFGTATVSALGLTSTNADVAGPSIALYHNSSTPAASDLPAALYVYGEDSAGNTQSYGEQGWVITDATSTSEDSRTYINVLSGGSSLTALTLGTTLGDGTFGHLFNTGSGAFAGIEIYNTATGSSGPQITLNHESASPADNDDLGYVIFAGDDDLGNFTQYSYIFGNSVDVTDATEDGDIRFVVKSGGSNLTALTLGTTTSLGVYGHQFNVGSGTNGTIEVQSTDATVNGPILSLYHNSSTPAAGDDVGFIRGDGEDSAGNFQNYGHMRFSIEDATSTSEDSSIKLVTISAGSNLTALTLGSTTNAVGTLGHAFDVSTTSFGGVQVTGSNTGAGGPGFMVYHNSASPAAADQVAYFDGYGEDSVGNTQYYGGMNIEIVDTTSTSEDSRMNLVVESAGATFNVLTLGGGNHRHGW